MSLPVSPSSDPALTRSHPEAVSLIGTPETARLPVIFASPHSGRDYSAALCERTTLALNQLRKSEDAYVDRLIEHAPKTGALLLCANFPRVFIDVNRSALELDPKMFSERLPEASYQETRRTASGLGVLPRVSAEGSPLYRRKFRLEEGKARLDAFYRPYHQALGDAIDGLKARFGFAIVLDMHSMPHQSARGADIVLGDRFGAACSPQLIAFAEHSFAREGLVAVRNTPYAGGYTTEHYGRPEMNVHALQIEINRGLYLDEGRVVPAPGFNRMREKITNFINAVAKLDWSVILQS